MAAANERKRGTPDAFSTLLWNNKPRKSNEIPSQRPTVVVDVPELKQHYLFREKTRKRPLSRTAILFSGASPELLFTIYRGRKNYRELWKLDWLAAKNSPSCASLFFEKFIAPREFNYGNVTFLMLPFYRNIRYVIATFGGASPK